MTRLLLGCALVGAAALLARCTDPTVIGGELLEGNQLPVAFTDTLPVRFSTELLDPSQASTFDVTAAPFPVGCIDDPLLGTLRASVGLQLLERDSGLTLLGTVVDSIVLVLPVDTAARLGEVGEVVSLRVVQAAPGTIDTTEATSATPLRTTDVVYGTYSAVPPVASATVNFFGNDTLSVDSVGPSIRIPLNDQFRADVSSALAANAPLDTTFSFRDSVFAENFAGIVVEATDCSGALAAVTIGGDGGARFGVKIFYTRDGRQRQYTLGAFRPTTTDFKVRPYYAHDYTGTLAAELLTGAASPDTLSVIQSLDGLYTEVVFPDVAALSGQAVNYALLEVPVVRDGFVEPLAGLLPARRDAVGNFTSLGASNAQFTAAFRPEEGGTLTRVAAEAGAGVDSVDVYRFNLTSYFQQIAEGNVDPVVALLPAGRIQVAGRSLLAGPGRAEGPRARLLLATTSLP